MLNRVIGLAFLAPLVLALTSTAAPFLLASKLQNSQRSSLEATEQRMEAIKQLLSSVRAARIEGMEKSVAKEIRNIRAKEIELMATYRRVEIVVVLVGKSNLPDLICVRESKPMKPPIPAPIVYLVR